MEKAACGSECSLARTCVEQILDLRVTLRCLGAPIRYLSHMFGDNKTVVDNSMMSHGKTHQRHVAFSFHRAREKIAVNIVNYLFINGKVNPDDILTKH